MGKARNLMKNLFKTEKAALTRSACDFCTVCSKMSDRPCKKKVLPGPSPSPMPTPIPAPLPNPTPKPIPSPVNNTQIPFELPGGMSLDKCDVIMSLVSIAENSTVKWWDNYTYCENIHDSRGMTVSLVGMCSGTSDLLWTFQNLKSINPKHPLLKYLPVLIKVDNTDNTSGLENLANDLKLYGDKEWRSSVWNTILHFYWTPSMQFAESIGLKYPISKGFVYDLSLNHGFLEVSKMADKVTTPIPNKGGDEKKWLEEYMAVRQHIITKVDTSTNNGQPDRVLLWKSVLTKGNVNLDRPLTQLLCYGDTFSIV